MDIKENAIIREPTGVDMIAVNDFIIKKKNKGEVIQ